MLQLVTEDNIVLDLYESTVIPLELTNPMFNERGSHSQAFDLPPTAKNLKVFGWPDRIGSLKVSTSLSIKVLFDGLLIMMPTLTVTGYNGKIRGWLAENEGSFYVAVKGKKLKDYEYESDTYAQGDYLTYLKSLVSSSYPSANFICYPVLNQDFYLDTPFYDAPVGFETYIHNCHQNYYYYYGGTPVYDTYQNKIITPFPYLCYLIDVIFNQSGYTIKSNPIYSDQELRTLTVFNINAVRRSDPRAVGTFDYYHDLANHVPDMTVLDFLRAIESKFCMTIFYNNILNTVNIKNNSDIIKGKVIVDITQLSSKPDDIEIEAQKDGYYLKQVVDANDDNFSALWNDIYDSENFISEPVATTAILNTITTDPINTIRLVLDNGYFYRYQVNDSTLNGEWVYYSRNFQNYKSGDGEAEFESDISHLISVPLHGDIQHSTGRSWIVPKVQQKGNDPDFYQGMTGREFTFRLMFYRGTRNDSNGDPYPFASEDVHDASGNPITGANYGLRYDGASGLYENFWKEFLYWWTEEKKKVTFKSKFNAHFISQLDFSSKYRIENMNYLLNTVKVNLGAKGISLAEVEAYTV